MIEGPFGAFVVFGIVWGIQLLIILEVLSIARATRAQLHTAVKKLAADLVALRESHEAHLSGEVAAASTALLPKKRRSTDVEDWVVESGIGDGATKGAKCLP